MDFEFFHKMSKIEAKEYFDHFLWEVIEGFESIVKDVESEGVMVDFSLESLPGVIQWTVEKIRTIPVAEDKSIPAWIRNTKEFQDGLFEFDYDSKILINRMVFYFGESFVKSYPNKLKWGIGNPKYMEKNMPVIKGFKKGIEMAPMMIVNNMIRTVLIEKKINMIDKVVEIWKSQI